LSAIHLIVASMSCFRRACLESDLGVFTSDVFNASIYSPIKNFQRPMSQKSLKIIGHH
jgi:hypothetical protein